MAGGDATGHAQRVPLAKIVRYYRTHLAISAKRYLSMIAFTPWYAGAVGFRLWAFLTLRIRAHCAMSKKVRRSPSEPAKPSVALSPHARSILDFTADFKPNADVAKAFRLDHARKIEKEGRRGLGSEAETPAGTEPISKEEFANAAGSTPPSLPESPPKLWPGRPAGRPVVSERDPLIAFLEETYGQYLPHHKNELRGYIRSHDPKLYQAICNYEKKSSLPEHLQMPSLQDKRTARFALAKAAGYPGFTDGQRAEAEAHLAKAATKPKRPVGPT
jgi:hypothetical protein